MMGDMRLISHWEQMCDMMAAELGLVKHRIPLPKGKYTYAYLPRNFSKADAEFMVKWIMLFVEDDEVKEEGKQEGKPQEGENQGDNA